MVTAGLLISVLGLAFLDSVNPSALFVTLWLLGQRGDASKVSAYLAAVFATYFAVGALLLLGLDAVRDYLSGPVGYGAQGALGAAMLLYAFFPISGAGEEERLRPPESGGVVGLAALGVAVTAIEFFTALPYLGAIAILANADLPPLAWLPVLVAYNLVFVFPPFSLLALYALFGARLEARLGRLRERARGGVSRNTLLWVVGIAGFLLLRDALCYFDFFGLLPCRSAVPEAYPETGCAGTRGRSA